MEVASMTVIGVWAFTIIWLVGMLAVGGDMFITLVLFFIAIVVSVAVTAIQKDSVAKKPTD